MSEAASNLEQVRSDLERVSEHFVALREEIARVVVVGLTLSQR